MAEGLQRAEGHRRHKEDFAPRLRRRVVSEYFDEVWGLQISPNTLAKWAVTGDGPPFQKWGRFPYYDTDVLDLFAIERLGTLRRSTSEDGRP
jgi:hypothetical protein